jgi:hypothetical protein
VAVCAAQLGSSCLLATISTTELRDEAVDLFQYQARIYVRDAFKILLFRTGN